MPLTLLRVRHDYCRIPYVWISLSSCKLGEGNTFKSWGLITNSFRSIFKPDVCQVGHCATSQKVAGSIPNGVIEICHWHNPSSRTVAWRLTWPLTEMSTRNASGGWRWPVHRADNLTTFMCRLSWYLGVSTSWNPQALSRPVQALLYLPLCVCQIAVLLWLACYRDLLGCVNVMIIVVGICKYNKIGAYNTRARKSDFLILWLCFKTVPSHPILLCCLSYERFILVPGGSIAQEGDKPCKTNACVFEAPEDMDSMHNYEQVNFFGLCVFCLNIW